MPDYKKTKNLHRKIDFMQRNDVKYKKGENKMTKNNNTADERLWILKECAKMKSVKVEAPPDAKSPEQMLREIKQEIERRKNL